MGKLAAPMYSYAKRSRRLQRRPRLRSPVILSTVLITTLCIVLSLRYMASISTETDGILQLGNGTRAVWHTTTSTMEELVPQFNEATILAFDDRREALEAFFNETVLPQCDTVWTATRKKWHGKLAAKGFHNVTRSIEYQRAQLKAAEKVARFLSRSVPQTWWSYDELTAATVSNRIFQYDPRTTNRSINAAICSASGIPSPTESGQSGSTSFLCDTWTVPFNRETDQRCRVFATTHIESAVAVYEKRLEMAVEVTEAEGEPLTPHNDSSLTSDFSSRKRIALGDTMGANSQDSLLSSILAAHTAQLGLAPQSDPCSQGFRSRLLGSVPSTIGGHLQAKSKAKWTGKKGWCVTVPYTGPVDLGHEDMKLVQVVVDPLAPSFSQRTLKFKVELTVWLTAEADTADRLENRSLLRVPSCPLETVSFIMKVPQRLFPNEPFAETAAFHLDRALGVRRVPLTFFRAVPLDLLQNAVRHRSETVIPVEEKFVRGESTSTYDKWIQFDFFGYLKHRADTSSSEVQTRNHGKEVWCSLQLFLREVRSLLGSALHMPYSRSTSPSWHTWFSPTGYTNTGVNYASLLALSQQATIDFIMSNRDRSPNKNSYVAGGCQACGKGERHEAVRRPSGLVPTLVHLDHGVAFSGRHSVENNPISKLSNGTSFCIFYRPLVLRLWALENKLAGIDPQHSACVGSQSRSPVKALQDANKRRRHFWNKFFQVVIPSNLVGGMRKGAQATAAAQTVYLLERVDACLRRFPQNVVLAP